MRKLVFSIFLLVLGGCALKPSPTIEGTNQFSTFGTLDEDETKIYVANDHLKEYKFIFLTSFESTLNLGQDFHQYLDGMLSSQKIQPIARRSEIENTFIVANKADEFPDLSSRIGYVKLTNKIGRYLLLSINVVQLTQTKYTVEARVYDPKEDKVYLQIKRNKIIWVDFEKEAILPVLNKIGEWYKDSSKFGEIPLESKNLPNQKLNI